MTITLTLAFVALGLEPRPGETMPAFRDRINAAIGRAA